MAPFCQELLQYMQSNTFQAAEHKTNVLVAACTYLTWTRPILNMRTLYLILIIITTDDLKHFPVQGG